MLFNIPGLSWFIPSSETERHERERRRRAFSEPTQMDVDGGEGSQTKCPLCNGNPLSPNLMVSTLSLMNLTQKEKGKSQGRIRIPLLYISTTVTSHFTSAPSLYFLMLAGNVIVLIMTMSCVQIYELLFALD